MSEKKIFGIDLGTTYSCIAYVEDDGRATIIDNLEGTSTTPSVVFFENEENVAVGQTAKDSAVLYPTQTVSFVKRLMGITNEAYDHFGRNISPPEVSSFILRKLAEDAEEELDCKVEDVVITCPAYFGDKEREATEKAGDIAGLNVLGILNEPTAAAINYGCTRNKEDKVILVYDLGGGTFDVTVIKIEGNRIDVVCTGGDHTLGGKDWDDAIIAYMQNEFIKQTGCDDDLSDNLETLQLFRQEAEKAKINLTSKESTKIVVQHEGQTARIELARNRFEEETQGLLNQTVTMTQDLINTAKAKGINKIDEFILVGGSSRMPQVAATLKEHFGYEAKLHDPDKAVAKGAALYALHMKQIQIINDTTKTDEQKKDEINNLPQSPRIGSSDNASDHIIVTNVTSRSYGIEALIGENKKNMISNIIIANTTVPCGETKTFLTIDDNQKDVALKVYESQFGEDLIELDDGEMIGEATLELQGNAPAGAQIEVNIMVNENGTVEVTGKEKSSGKEVKSRFERQSSISAEELEQVKELSNKLRLVE